MATKNVVHVHIDLADQILQMQLDGWDHRRLVELLMGARLSPHAAGAVEVNLDSFYGADGQPINATGVNHHPDWLDLLGANDVQG